MQSRGHCLGGFINDQQHPGIRGKGNFSGEKEDTVQNAAVVGFKGGKKLWLAVVGELEQAGAGVPLAHKETALCIDSEGAKDGGGVLVGRGEGDLSAQKGEGGIVEGHDGDAEVAAADGNEVVPTGNAVDKAEGVGEQLAGAEKFRGVDDLHAGLEIVGHEEHLTGLVPGEGLGVIDEGVARAKAGGLFGAVPLVAVNPGRSGGNIEDAILQEEVCGDSFGGPEGDFDRRALGRGFDEPEAEEAVGQEMSTFSKGKRGKGEPVGAMGLRGDGAGLVEREEGHALECHGGNEGAGFRIPIEMAGGAGEGIGEGLRGRDGGHQEQQNQVEDAQMQGRVPFVRFHGA